MRTKQRHGVCAKAQTGGNVIFDHLFTQRHGRQMGCGFVKGFAVQISGKQGQWLGRGDRLGRPKRLAPGQAKIRGGEEGREREEDYSPPRKKIKQFDV